eukprot:Skav205623  [mRNA]  locus=scaffold4676:48547:48780:- [translate_table: standard]
MPQKLLVAHFPHFPLPLLQSRKIRHHHWSASVAGGDWGKHSRSSSSCHLWHSPGTANLERQRFQGRLLSRYGIMAVR